MDRHSSVEVADSQVKRTAGVATLVCEQTYITGEAGLGSAG
jgi:hypothetical protein